MSTPSFASLGLPEPLVDTVSGLGFTSPTPIQALAIEPGLRGRDVLGLAQTGTGKTAAFGLPLVTRLMRRTGGARPKGRARHGARALILAPTRELADQIYDSLGDFARGTGLRGCVIYGGVGQRPQVTRLRAGVDVIIATPGRLMDLMDQGHIDFRSIEMLVLDEVDRMLDMGFIAPIRKITAALPPERQTLLFSATMPGETARLAESLLSDPVRVEVERERPTELKIEQA